jgi:hypothetical protein
MKIFLITAVLAGLAAASPAHAMCDIGMDIGDFMNCQQAEQNRREMLENQREMLEEQRQIREELEELNDGF